MKRRAKRGNGDTMTLFPFLAVLICTVGALIVLLVIVMQQARVTAQQVANVQPNSAAASDSQSSPPEIPDAPLLAAEVPAVDVATTDNELTESPSKPDPMNEPTLRSAADNWDELVSAAQLEREKYLWEIEVLQQSRQRTIKRLRSKRTEVSHLEDHIRRLREQMEELEKSAAKLASSPSATPDPATAASKLAQIQQQIATARQQVAVAREQAANRQRTFMVVPYEGQHGTNRQPFYVECRADSVVIQPLGIVLGRDDFQAPLGPNNPLAAALRATREFMVGLYGAQAPEPYPLLIVRPAGARSFVACRRALKDWEHDFGYELVAGDLALTYPTVDSELAKRINTTITQSRKRRVEVRELLAVTGNDSYGPALRVSGSAGGFVSRDGRPAGTYHGKSIHGRPTSGGLISGTARTSPGKRQHGRGDNSSANPGLAQSGRAATGTSDNRFVAGDLSADNADTFQPGTPLPLPTPTDVGPGNGPTPSADGGDFPWPTPQLAASNSTADHASGDFTLNESQDKNSLPAGQSPQTAGTGNSFANDETSGAFASENAVATGSPTPTESIADTRGNDWALPDAASGAIGITRPITLRINTSYLQLNPEVGTQAQPRLLPFQGSVHDAIQPLVNDIWNRIDEWGSAGPGVYWKPKLEVTVDPGAEREFQTLEALLRGSGLDIKRR